MFINGHKLYISHIISRVVSGTNQKRTKATKGLPALPPEIDCNQTTMGLPPHTTAVFLIAKSFW
jgi:hypothetical protein